MSRSPVLSVRVTPEERSLLEDAAAATHATISEFARRAALLLAEEELMRQNTIVIPTDRWAEIEALASEPASAEPLLTELSGRKPIWQR